MGILDDLKHKAEELGEKAREGLDAARDRAGDLVDDVRGRLGQHEGGQGGQEGEHAPTSESGDVGPDSSSTDAVQPGYVTGEDDVAGSEDGDSSLTDDAEATDDPETDDALADDSVADDSVADDSVADSVVEQEGLAASFGDGSGGIETTETDAPDTVDPAGAEGVEGGGAGLGDATSGADAGEAEPSAGFASDVPDTVDPAGAEGLDGTAGEDAGPDGSGAEDAGEDTGGDAADEAPLEPVATNVDPYDEPLSESIGAELSDADREALAEAVEDGRSEQGS